MSTANDGISIYTLILSILGSSLLAASLTAIANYIFYRFQRDDRRFELMLPIKIDEYDKIRKHISELVNITAKYKFEETGKNVLAQKMVDTMEFVSASSFMPPATMAEIRDNIADYLTFVANFDQNDNDSLSLNKETMRVLVTINSIINQDLGVMKYITKNK